MVLDKRVQSARDAVHDIKDGSIILVGGFGPAGAPDVLIKAVLDVGVRELHIVSNNTGGDDYGVSSLIRAGRVRRITCSYPRSRGSDWFEGMYKSGSVELSLVPQGTLSERIRAGGAGIGGFYTRTGIGTELTKGRETRCIDGQEYVFERPLKGDVALVRADRADRWGNLTYHAAARNFGPTMAAAARLTIAEVRSLVELGSLDPEAIVSPGVFVNRVVETG